MKSSLSLVFFFVLFVGLYNFQDNCASSTETEDDSLKENGVEDPEPYTAHRANEMFVRNRRSNQPEKPSLTKIRNPSNPLVEEFGKKIREIETTDQENTKKFQQLESKISAMEIADQDNKKINKDLEEKLRAIQALIQENTSKDQKLDEKIIKIEKGVDNKMNGIETILSGYHLTTPFIWRITDYGSKKANNTEIYSDPFYTTKYGYKLKMNFFYNGHKDGQGTHISIYMVIQPGEYDALLLWPFSHKVTITLLDQSKTAEKNNKEFAVFVESDSKLPECFQRPLNNKANRGVGDRTFVSNELLVEGGKYVKDDTLFIKMTTSG